MIYYSFLVFVLDNTGKYFYIYAMLISMMLLLLAITIFPNFIAHWIFKFEELDDSKLKSQIEKIAKELKFPLKQIRI